MKKGSLGTHAQIKITPAQRARWAKRKLREEQKWAKNNGQVVVRKATTEELSHFKDP